MNDRQRQRAISRDNLHRPPDRRLGLMTVVGSLIPLVFFLALSRSDDLRNGRLGPWAEVLLPVFGLLVVGSALLSAISDFQAPDQQERIVRLRTLSTAVRVLAFAVFAVNMASFILSG